jgi:hypothetical protein
MATDALIKQRDGIVGNWQGQTLSPAPRTLEAPTNLRAWEPWVRAAVIDFDLLSHLHFTRHKETFSYKDNGVAVSKTSNLRSVTLWHLHVTSTAANPSPKATSSRVATIIRPTPAIFTRQLDFLDQYSDLREDRASEIICELGPQYAFWGSVANLHPDRNKKTLELLDAALRLANFVEMRIKHALACRRPNELSSQVQPIILTPGHGTFPSGHSTENHMIARILWELRGREPVLGEQLMREAARIAVNRTVAGVHFPVDTAVGQVLGLTLGRYFIQRAKGGAQQFRAWRFDGERYPGNQDFDFHNFYDAATAVERPDPNVNPPYVDAIPSQAPAVSRILNWLWTEAVNEWS